MKRKFKISFNLIIGILSIILGCIIYLLWRETNLLMFSWFETIGFSPIILNLRESVAISLKNYPRWIFFSLPLALWYFGGILILSHIWDKFLSEKICWVFFFSIIAFGSEFGQLLNLVPGTYDSNDIHLMLFFIPIIILINIKQIIKEYQNEKV